MAPGRNDAASSMHHAVCTFLAVSSVCLLVGCGGDSTTPTQSTPAPVVTTVVLSASLDTLFTAGATSQLTAVAQTSSGSPVSGKVFTWLSTDPSVATVDNTGLVTAAGPNGSTTVSASTDGVVANQVIVVATGPQGGTVVAQSGSVTLDFPAGALTQAQSVTVTGPPATLPEADRIVSGAVFEFGPDGLVFNNPVQLTIAYSAANIPMGVNEADLRLHKLEAGVWVEVNGGTLDVVAKTVTGAIDGFSTYGVIGGGLPPTPAAPDLPLAVLGNAQTCALLASNAAWCWGENANGVFGDGTQDDSYNVPVPAGSGQQFSSLSMSLASRFTCGVDLVGDVFCWGSNGNGIWPGGADAATPQLVVSGMGFVVVDVGEEHVCGLDVIGQAYCWGRNGAGQVGDGTVMDRVSPTAVSTNLLFQSIVAGSDFTCALHGSGASYCWGYNSNGQLGDGTNTDRHSPVLVTGSHTFSRLSAGRSHACGVTATQGAFCWGANNSGELGDGTQGDSNVPVAVSGGHKVKSVSAGWEFSCLVDVMDIGWCWGEGEDGQLGTGSFDEPLVPTLVAGGFQWKSITPGEEHSCGVTMADEFKCWGERLAGGLGDGSPRVLTSPVAVTGGLSFQSIDAQSYTCAVDLSGGAHCWGGGLVGDGTPNGRYAPTAVAGGLTFQSVSVGREFACGVTNANDINCWGLNMSGNLGDGTNSQRLAPVPITSMLSFDAVSAGDHHACALTTSDALWCWGNGFNFEFGNGVQESSTSPVAAAGGALFSSVSVAHQTCGVTPTEEGYCWGTTPSGSVDMSPALIPGALSFRHLSTGSGNTHTCAVTTTDEAYCWGQNTFGELGDGTTTPRAGPVLVAGGVAFSIVQPGVFHTCGIDTSGTVYCWGDNSDGQLGNGTVGGQSLTPMAVAGGLSFSDVTAGWGWSCGITTTNEAYCWGIATQVGTGLGPSVNSPVSVVFP